MYKERIFKYILILILIVSVLLCAYSLYNYKGSTAAIMGNIQRHFLQGNIGQMWGDGSQRQGRWFQGGNQAQSGLPQGGNLPGISQNTRNFRGFRSTSSKYGPYIMAHSIIILFLFILSFYLLKNKKFKLDFIDDKFTIICLLLIGFFMRLYLASSVEGFAGDISLFRSWASSASNSLLNFYKNTPSCDYPPLYIYVLYVIGKIANIHNASYYYTILLKLPSILADILTSYIIYKIAKKHFAKELSAVISALYILNPAVFINSSAWGQVDSFFTLLIVAAVYFLSERKITLSSVFFTAAVLMKPQGIIFAPVLFFELVNERSFKTFLKAFAALLITAVVVVVPFAIGQDPMWIFKLYAKTISEYPYATVNGFNFFGLLGANYVNDSSTLLVFSYRVWGFIFIVITTAFSWFAYMKAKNSTFAFTSSLIQIAGVFTFSTGMHERYLFPAVALAILAFLYIKDIRLLGLFIGFSVTSYLNMYYVLFTNLGMSFGFVPMMISLLNVVLTIYLAKVAYDFAVLNKVYSFDEYAASHKIHTNI